MSEIMIRVENISKQYYLGKMGSGRFREDFKYWVSPIAKNKRPVEEDQRNILWALKNVSFDVKQGEVLGIIGNNGAGKSTLLKIISRITSPSAGSVYGNGRIASLLEVGTGFHGELTGRENIFLNGSILGMKKKEIESRFEEIVDFSGVERFIDTPVKRYSSGMYTRLAFAVAAHMDPEILIVDEVLAVGDAEFQRKCLGKMKEVSAKDGKTVLFVSHNMQALKNLCHRAITLEQGQVTDSGDPETIIGNYLKKEKNISTGYSFDDISSAPGNENIRIRSVSFEPQLIEGQLVADIRTALTIRFAFWHTDHQAGNLTVGVHLFSMAGEFIFDICSDGMLNKTGLINGSCEIPGNFLNDGAYYISIVFVKDTTTRLFYYESCLQFDIEDYRANTAWFGKWKGTVRPSFPVNLTVTDTL